MLVTPIKTHKITTKDNLFAIIDQYLLKLSEQSVVAIASKIVGIMEQRVVKLSDEEKDALIKKEADFYLPKEKNKYGLYVTIKNHYLTYSSGIDESNVEEGSVLWPENPQESANKIREHLAKKFTIKNIGVIITDMATMPLQKAITTGAIAWSGFMPFKDITGSSDVFGRKFKYSWEGHLQGLAAAAGVVMGEGSQQSPVSIITDIPFVEFVNRNPTEEEIKSLQIEPESDMYGQMINAVKWTKGGE